MTDRHIKGVATRVIQRPIYQAEATFHLFNKKSEVLAEKLLQEVFRQLRQIYGKAEGDEQNAL